MFGLGNIREEAAGHSVSAQGDGLLWVPPIEGLQWFETDLKLLSLFWGNAVSGPGSRLGDCKSEPPHGVGDGYSWYIHAKHMGCRQPRHKSAVLRCLGPLYFAYD